MLKYEDEMLILNQDYTFCGRSLIILYVSYLHLKAWIYLTAWLNRTCYRPGRCNQAQAIQ